MLINGDLVRVPQGAVIMDIGKDPVPIQVATKPKIGIIIDNKPPEEDLIKILLDNELYLVDKRVLQLVGV
jgi:hypothetical protein